jgi:Fe-S cluster assembly protein SufD
LLALDRTTHERFTQHLPEALKNDAALSFDAFASMAHPSPTAEDWRYVDVPADLADRRLPEAAGAEPTDSKYEAALGELAGRASIVDGFVSAIGGSHITGFDTADLSAFTRDAPADRFAAAARAFGGDGVVIAAGRGEHVEHPVYVSFEAATPDSLSIPRVFVVGGEASAVEVVIEQRSPDGVDALILPDIEVVAAQAARISVTVIQTWGDTTTAVGRHHLRAGRDGFVELAEAAYGARFSRLHLTVDLEGQGADARITGAYFGDTDQTLDYRYFMNHQGPNTTSEMFLKGAVAGHARSVFTGLIRIEPEGQGTNAHQTNRNLVLSDDAEAHSVPNLEILANDVRCGHGSAVGPLDEEQRYYLMSRGLPRERADRLQVLGFFEEALQRFPQQQIEPMLRNSAMSKYDMVAS